MLTTESYYNRRPTIHHNNNYQPSYGSYSFSGFPSFPSFPASYSTISLGSFQYAETLNRHSFPIQASVNYTTPTSWSAPFIPSSGYSPPVLQKFSSSNPSTYPYPSHVTAQQSPNIQSTFIQPIKPTIPPVETSSKLNSVNLNTLSDNSTISPRITISPVPEINIIDNNSSLSNIAGSRSIISNNSTLCRVKTLKPRHIDPDLIPFVEEIARIIAQNDKSLREQFASFDSNRYGFLTHSDFRSFLQSLKLGITMDQESRLVQAFDFDNDDRVEYYEFHTHINEFVKDIRSFTPNQSTLRQVIVITRHGARFPVKQMPHNTQWPNHEQFWKSFTGYLTPYGANQHLELGREFKKKYIDGEGLLDLDDPHLTDKVLATSSNTNRTLYSAMNFLSGMFPIIPVIIRENRKEQTKVDYDRGIFLNIDFDVKHTPLLHGMRNPCFESLTTHSQDLGLKEYAERKDVQELIDKLWKITGFAKLDPEKGPYKRVKGIKTCLTQLEVERAARMPVFVSEVDLVITPPEEALIKEIGYRSHHLKFQGATPELQKHHGIQGAGLLPAEIIKHMRALKYRFVLYSAHDTTIMALLSHLGIRDWEVPQFAAHIGFELHEIDGKYYVKMFYNYDPEKPECYFKYITPPRESIELASQLKNEPILLDEFEQIIWQRGSYRNQEEWQKGVTVPVPGVGIKPPK